MPEPDFSGLDRAAQAAFKPDFVALLRQARRRRWRNRAIGAVAVIALLAGGGTSLARLPGPDMPPDPGTTTPTPTNTPDFIPVPGPSRTPVPPGTPQPPAFWPIVASDLDHLYALYRDCRADKCEFGVVSTADGGHSWRTSPLPVPAESIGLLRPLSAQTVLARIQSQTADSTGTLTSSGQIWLASTDGGVTWREVTVSPADVVPAGWTALWTREMIMRGEPLVAADPATGDVVEVPRTSALETGNPVQTVPASAGIWVSGYSRSKVGAGGRISYSGSAVEVSKDGGRTWRLRRFPTDISAAEDSGAAIATVDGRTVYAVGRRQGALVIYRSTDGGGSWRRAKGTAPVGERSISAALRPDGTLVIQAGQQASEDPLMFTSTDQGGSLQPEPLGPGAAAIPVPGGYAQSGRPSSNGIWLSPDGDDWAYIGSPTLR